MLEFSIRLLSSKNTEDFEREWSDNFTLSSSDFWKERINRIDRKHHPIYSNIYRATIRNDKLDGLPEQLLRKLEDTFTGYLGLEKSEREINQMLEGIANRRLLDNNPDLIAVLEREFTEICEVLEEFFSLSTF